MVEAYDDCVVMKVAGYGSDAAQELTSMGSQGMDTTVKRQIK